MKIAIVSKSDKSGGGASKVAEDLTNILNKKGHIAHHYHSRTVKNNSGKTKPLYGFFQKIFRVIYAALRKLGLSGLFPIELPFLLIALRKNQYDIIHFHDLSSAISPFTLIYLAKRIPVVWTLHDCSPFTGGCLYPMGCIKFQTICQSCPQLGAWPIDSWIDLTFIDQWFKKKLHKNVNIHLITPSIWMADTALLSPAIHTAPIIISNGIDTGIFRKLDKIKLKKEFSIPCDQVVILLSACSLSDERKGMSFSIDVLNLIHDLNPYLILVGEVNLEIKQLLVNFEYYEAGYLSSDIALNKHYAMADLFLFCSLADNQPLSVLETMASGTPTVGFKTGGIPEMIVQNKTGYLVDIKNVEALAAVLRQTIVDKLYIAWGANARKRAEEKYSDVIALNNHLNFYNSLRK